MLEIVLLGINHETAPIEVRECIAFSEDESKSALHALLGKTFIKEALLFSTCNRVEVLVVTDNTPRAVEETKNKPNNKQISDKDFIMPPLN